MQRYPRLSIEYKGGDLIRVHQVSYEELNQGQVEQTFRRAGAGMSHGPGSYKINFKHKLSEKPVERDFRSAVRNREIDQLVVVFPDGTRDVVDGGFNTRSGESGLEGAVEESMEYVGVVA